MSIVLVFLLFAAGFRSITDTKLRMPMVAHTVLPLLIVVPFVAHELGRPHAQHLPLMVGLYIAYVGGLVAGRTLDRAMGFAH